MYSSINSFGFGHSVSSFGQKSWPRKVASSRATTYTVGELGCTCIICERTVYIRGAWYIRNVYAISHLQCCRVQNHLLFHWLPSSYTYKPQAPLHHHQWSQQASSSKVLHCHFPSALQACIYQQLSSLPHDNKELVCCKENAEIVKRAVLVRRVSCAI